MTTEANVDDLTVWLSKYYGAITPSQLQTLIVAGEPLTAALPADKRATITEELRPHKLRLIVVHEQAVLNRIRDNETLRPLFPTLNTGAGREWLARELTEIKKLANA